jgi:ketosteroid isomerase-like protein
VNPNAAHLRVYAGGIGNAAIIEELTRLWETDRLDEAGALFDPAIEWFEPPETIGRSIVSGEDAVRASLANWSEQFDALRIETHELREEGDRVLHAMTQFARAGGSSVEIPAELYMVWWFRDGKATRMEMYNARDQAEEAFARER